MKKFFNSIKYALRGLKFTFQHEQNFRIQIIAGTVVLCAMLYFQVRRAEMIVLLLIVMLVLLLELLNSALERFADLLKPRLLVHVETVKNIMAAMVLLASVFSLIIGAIIFTPYVIDRFF